MARDKTVDGGLFTGQPCQVAYGIDQSYSGFGLTVITMDGSRYHTWTYCSPLTGVDRLVDIQGWLLGTLRDVQWRGFTFVRGAMEGYAFASQVATMAGELGAAVKLALQEHFPPEKGSTGYPLIVAPASVKKYATGRGNAKKQEMLLSVFKTFDVEFRDDNMADSYVIARIAANIATNEAQRDVLGKCRSEWQREPVKAR